MAWMDLKSFSIDDLRILRNEFEIILENKYPVVEIDVFGNTKRCFQLTDGSIIYPGFMFGGKDNEFHCLVIEYANSVKDIQNYLEEEGRQFFPEDFLSKDEMFKAMLKEIED